MFKLQSGNRRVERDFDPLIVKPSQVIDPWNEILTRGARAKVPAKLLRHGACAELLAMRARSASRVHRKRKA